MDIRDIEHMWKVASNNPNHDTNWHDPVVIAFANLVAAQEREACAKLCDEVGKESASHWPYRFANMIRARGTT